MNIEPIGIVKSPGLSLTCQGCLFLGKIAGKLLKAGIKVET